MLERDFAGGVEIIGTSHVYLKSHTIRLDSSGIIGRGEGTKNISGDGTITAIGNILNVRNATWNTLRDGKEVHNELIINSVIANSAAGKTQFRLSGDLGPRPGWAITYLGGAKSNTFTGDVVIDGAGHYLGLNKKNGAVAIRGNVYVSKGLLAFHDNNQLSRESDIILDQGHLYFTNPAPYMSNTFRNLVVVRRGVLEFGALEHVGSRYFYMDDIEIANAGSLIVKSWRSTRDFFLVKKNSQNLAESLKRIEFDGYNGNTIHLREFNEEYWEIAAILPEPAAYGGSVMGIALALTALRRRRQRRVS